MTNINLTQNQQLLLNALLSMLIAALITGSTAAYQLSLGSVNFGLILSIGWTTFLGCMAKSLYDFVPGHIAQLIQGLQDTVAELRKAPAPVQPVQIVVHHIASQAQQPQFEAIQPIAPPIVLTHSDISTPVQQAPMVTTETPKNAVEIGTKTQTTAMQEDDTKPLAAVHAERAAQT